MALFRICFHAFCALQADSISGHSWFSLSYAYLARPRNAACIENLLDISQATHKKQ